MGDGYKRTIGGVMLSSVLYSGQSRTPKDATMKEVNFKLKDKYQTDVCKEVSCPLGSKTLVLRFKQIIRVSRSSQCVDENLQTYDSIPSSILLTVCTRVEASITPIGSVELAESNGNVA